MLDVEGERRRSKQRSSEVEVEDGVEVLEVLEVQDWSSPVQDERPSVPRLADVGPVQFAVVVELGLGQDAS